MRIIMDTYAKESLTELSIYPAYIGVSFLGESGETGWFALFRVAEHRPSCLTRSFFWHPATTWFGDAARMACSLGSSARAPARRPGHPWCLQCLALPKWVAQRERELGSRAMGEVGSALLAGHRQRRSRRRQRPRRWRRRGAPPTSHTGLAGSLRSCARWSAPC